MVWVYLCAFGCTIDSRLPRLGVPARPYMGDTMDKPAQNIQDSFLNNARKDKTAITLYLLSGVKLSGRIKSFDKYSLILETNNQEQLIFKHAISTVVTMKAGHGYTASSSSQSASHAPAGSPP